MQEGRVESQQPHRIGLNMLVRSETSEKEVEGKQGEHVGRPFSFVPSQNGRSMSSFHQPCPDATNGLPFMPISWGGLEDQWGGISSSPISRVWLGETLRDPPLQAVPSVHRFGRRRCSLSGSSRGRRAACAGLRSAPGPEGRVWLFGEGRVGQFMVRRGRSSARWHPEKGIKNQSMDVGG